MSPPVPVTLIVPPPSPLEAAAIAAALERFRQDTAAAPAAPPPSPGGWLILARLEAVGSEPQSLAPWDERSPWVAATGPPLSNP